MIEDHKNQKNSELELAQQHDFHTMKTGWTLNKGINRIQTGLY